MVVLWPCITVQFLNLVSLVPTKYTSSPLTADKKQQPRWVSQCRSSSPASSARRRCVSTSVAGGRARE